MFLNQKRRSPILCLDGFICTVGDMSADYLLPDCGGTLNGLSSHRLGEEGDSGCSCQYLRSTNLELGIRPCTHRRRGEKSVDTAVNDTLLLSGIGQNCSIVHVTGIV